MKINSSKIVQFYILLIGICVFLLTVCSVLLWLFDLHWIIRIVFLLSMLCIIFYLVQKCFIVDYDSTGEVLSVKKNFFLFPKKIELFEIPKIYVTKWKIENKIWNSYLILDFENSEGRKLRRYIDISSYTQQQKISLESDLNKYDERK